MNYPTLILLVTFLDVAFCLSWNVTYQLNPDCSTNCSEFNVVHVAGRHSNFSTHFLFTASKHIGPSVIALYSSDPIASPKLKWDVLANGTDHPVKAIDLSGHIQSYAVVFTQLIDYDDLADTADVAKASASSLRVHPLNEFSWNLATNIGPGVHALENNEIIQVTFTGNSSNPLFGSDGLVNLVFMFSNAEQHNPRMPSLPFVPGLSLQFELHLLNLHSNFTRGRFATQLALISEDPIASDQDFSESRVFSINDEVAPGIFEMINVRLGERTYRSPTKPLGSSDPGGFLQTRPVCYVSEQVRDVKTSRDARLSTTRDQASSDILACSLPFWFYGAQVESVGLRVQNVSFGTTEDGFYAGSNCVIWSASFGFGEPPTDSLSPLLIGLVSLSVIVILGSLILGSLLLLVRSFRTRRTPASEPLLSRSEQA